MERRRIVPPDEYPWWVQVSLWGVPWGRTGQWLMIGICLLAAVGCVIYGLEYDRRFLLGSLLVLSAIPYWLSIRWIDRHGSWGARPARDEDGD